MITSHSFRIALILLCFSIIIFSCSSSKVVINNAQQSTIEQIFLSPVTGKTPPAAAQSGKCYSQSTRENELRWTEAICDAQLSKAVITQIQDNLIRLKYTIYASEIADRKLWKSNKEAIKQFQIDEGLAFGAVDWATVNLLRK